MAGDAPAAPEPSGLAPYRRHLDELDEQIARLLGERFEICREIARHKLEHGIPMMAPDRVAEVRARYLAHGTAAKLPPDFSAELFELLIGATCRMEDELMAALADPLEPASPVREADRPGARGTSQASRRQQ
jgi:4-amino-4-deoxychorismate mutase